MPKGINFFSTNNSSDISQVESAEGKVYADFITIYLIEIERLFSKRKTR